MNFVANHHSHGSTRMNTDKTPKLCHPERAFCAKDLCNSSVPPVVKILILIRENPRKSAAKSH